MGVVKLFVQRWSSKVADDSPNHVGLSIKQNEPELVTEFKYDAILWFASLCNKFML